MVAELEVLQVYIKKLRLIMMILFSIWNGNEFYIQYAVHSHYKYYYLCLL